MIKKWQFLVNSHFGYDADSRQEMSPLIASFLETLEP